MKWPCPDSPRAVPSQVSALESNQRFPIDFIRRFPSAPSSLDSTATADIRRRSGNPVRILQLHLRLANRVIDAPTQKRRSRYFARKMPLSHINGHPLPYRQPCIFTSVERHEIWHSPERTTIQCVLQICRYLARIRERIWRRQSDSAYEARSCPFFSGSFPSYGHYIEPPVRSSGKASCKAERNLKLPRMILNRNRLPLFNCRLNKHFRWVSTK
jgi:hypothetical protein